MSIATTIAGRPHSEADLASKAARVDELEGRLRRFMRLLDDDAFASSFQTTGQYRAGLAKTVKGEMA